jgi:hypothetical protein
MEGSQHLDNLNKEHLKSDGEELRGQSTVKTKKNQVSSISRVEFILIILKKEKERKRKKWIIQ